MSVTKFWNATNDKKKKMTNKELESIVDEAVDKAHKFSFASPCGEDPHDAEKTYFRIAKRFIVELLAKHVGLEDELLPCPFCGSDDVERVMEMYDQHYAIFNNYVICNNCNVSTPFSEDKEKVVCIWNKRTPQDE